MTPSGLFDWPFFILYFSVGLLAFCAQIMHFSPPGYLPHWASHGTGEVFLNLFLFPLGFLEPVTQIYGFLILPWYIVVICWITEVVVGGWVHGIVFQPITRQAGPFVAFFLALIITVIAIVWYFFYASEPRTVTLTLGGSIGIVIVVILRVVNMVRFLRKPEYTREFEEQQRFSFWKKR